QDPTQGGAVLGTPPYMAPEQADGRLDLIDAHTDVYGLGAILYEILSGGAPFPGKVAADMLNRVRHNPPRPPRELVRDAPAALEVGLVAVNVEKAKTAQAL